MRHYQLCWQGSDERKTRDYLTCGCPIHDRLLQLSTEGTPKLKDEWIIIPPNLHDNNCHRTNDNSYNLIRQQHDARAIKTSMTRSDLLLVSCSSARKYSLQ